MLKNIRADINRFYPEGRFSIRHLIRGLLSQGFHALLVYRVFNWFHRHRIPAQPIRFLCERLIEITTGISIPAQCTIGKGCRIHHFGGIVFHPSVSLGENCTVYHNVTIGDKGQRGLAATIGNNVLLGTGCAVIGEITIGDNCRIGANAVVTKSVLPDNIVFGNPAQTRKLER